nr:hypothetical protein [Tanacetum cinerariifolium]
MGCRRKEKHQLKKDLGKLDSNIDSGRGKDELIKKRLETIHHIQKLDILEALETAQKAKIKWAIDGDENTRFYHGIINKRCSIQNIKGIIVEGKWIDEPDMVKKEFIDHFTNRFCKPVKSTASIDANFPNQLDSDQQSFLERDVTNAEIKKAVWECGTDKAPGPDGFSFGFLGISGRIINEVQSAFIEDRQILDGPFILNEVMSWCKRKKTFLFNVDFEKAYDSMRWDFLDDILCEWSESNIISLIHVLDCFHRVSGLKIYLNKSKLMGIEVDSAKVTRAAGSTPIFHMSLFKVPSGTLCLLESIRGKVFNGHDFSSKKVSWVQWDKRFLAHESSLWSRVINAIHEADRNIGGIPKHDASSCWLNIINEVKVLEKKGIHLLNYMHMNLGNGFATSFWDDRWCTDGRLKDLYPRVYALENHKKITVGEKLAQLSSVYSFRRVPRGGAESSQVEELKRLIQPVILKQGKDSWNWSLSKSDTYSVASVRNLIDYSLLPSSDMKTMWISYIPNKVNVFAWKHKTPVFTCDLAKQVSKLIARWWDISYMDIDYYDNWRNWIDNIKLPCKNKLMLEGIFL